VVLIDPGPIDPAHEKAIARAIDDSRVEAVLVTHTHPDHAPLANPLARQLGVPAMGHQSGPEFTPDLRLSAGDRVAVGGVDLAVMETPGHSVDHLCFLVGRILFTGDHIIGGSSVLIEDLAAYLASLAAVRSLDLDALYPGHGEVMDRPYDVIDWNLAHRLQRESEIMQAVAAGAHTAAAVVEGVYADVDPGLMPLAARNVDAHLRKLAADGRIAFDGDRWRLSDEDGRPAS
jgi:glyoxylase-like metal-dependent hydrolase (beta-lactamase superfamily II)